ncbi:MAG: TetR/AcrR family transcriptional regulator [Alphaproteobacteria bacterium]|nr:TetR/AcrR family transcriptional regulator [Alphaproteobacteria bacterium]
MRRKNTTGKMMMNYIAEALLILMRDHPYPNITIGNITKKAGVNRSTYYRHFDSKESVIKFFLDSVMSEYLGSFKKLKSRDFSIYLLIMFRTFYFHKNELLNIHKAGLSFLLSEVFVKHFDFEKITKISNLKEQYELSYHLGGIYNNMLLWFSHEMAETPETMTEIAISYGLRNNLTLFELSVSKI